MNDLIISRDARAHRGRRLEYVHNRLEQPGRRLIGIGAGMLAGSVSLVGFGIDKDAVRCKRCLPTSRLRGSDRLMSDLVIYDSSRGSPLKHPLTFAYSKYQSINAINCASPSARLLSDSRAL